MHMHEGHLAIHTYNLIFANCKSSLSSVFCSVVDQANLIGLMNLINLMDLMHLFPDPEEVLSVTIQLEGPQRPLLGGSLLLPCYFEVCN